MAASISPAQDVLLPLFGELALEEASSATTLLPYFVTEGGLLGLYTVVTVAAVRGFLRRPQRSRFNVSLMCACIVMYLLAATHLGISTWVIYTRQRHARDLLRSLTLCLGLRPDLAACNEATLFKDGGWPTGWPVTAKVYCELSVIAVGVDAAALVAILVHAYYAVRRLKVILSDAIVIWRACVLWPRHRVVQAVSIMLFLASLGTLVYGAFREVLSLSGTVLSWAINLWTTALVSWKAWRHHRNMRPFTAGHNAPTKVEKVLRVFVESGFLYTAGWTVIMIFSSYFTAVGSKNGGAAYLEDHSDLPNFLQNFTLSVFIQLVSIYPMLTIVLVDYTNSCYHPRALERLPGELDVYTESRDNTADRAIRLSLARVATTPGSSPVVDLEAVHKIDKHALPPASLRSSLQYAVVQRNGHRDVSRAPQLQSELCTEAP
ncbi:hypothetical protein PsYK624_033020 [Phanerochaete sordida]|uniref:Uncharacterized protein n=1 Tax=Phanerochaete sordida TaxID=48140 RepID=A0A9P3LA61_9APHY|nr:hypothetical protein PsYK624_033020 [Phanerochaete sordida]